MLTVQFGQEPEPPMVGDATVASVVETAHLLRSTINAARLGAALRRALAGGGRPVSLAVLRRELRLGDD